MAADFATWSSRRRFDDIGTFDSLILAKPYRALLDLSGAAPRLNLQIVNGAALARPALQAGGAVLVMTTHFRPDLVLAGRRSGLNLYSVPDPTPRAGFYGPQSVKFLSEDTIPNALRTHVYTKDLILMPERSRNTVLPVTSSGSTGTVVYNRPSSDEILLDVSAGGSGFVNVVESYDPGWLVRVDGQEAPVFAANGFTLAAPVPAGKHAVRFLYRTPGRGLGMLLSLLAAGLLGGLIWLSPRVAPSDSPARAAAAASRFRAVTTGSGSVKPVVQTRRQRRRR